MAEKPTTDADDQNGPELVLEGGPFTRSILPGPGFKEPVEGKMPVLVGQFAPYDEWAEINSKVEAPFPFMERLSRGAFSKSAKDNRDRLRVLFQHGEDPQVGIKPLGRIQRLEEGPKSIEYEVALFDTEYVRSLLPALESGQFGTSWTFFPIKDKSSVTRGQRSTWNPKGIPEVTHHEVKLVEFGPCMFQAYAGATAGVRSLTDYFLFNRFARDPQYLEQLLTTFARPATVSAETALSNEQAEGEPHLGAESRSVPLVPVHPRFNTDQQWLDWCLSAMK